MSKLFGKSDGSVTIKNSIDLSLYLLETANVSTVAGEAFGAPECLRLSYAIGEEQMATAIRRIKLAVQKLN